jgi:hypothetical protein
VLDPAEAAGLVRLATQHERAAAPLARVAEQAIDLCALLAATE